MSNQVYGHDLYSNFYCSDCHQTVNAELIEVRVYTAIYKCPRCGNKIKKKTFFGVVFDIVSFGLLNKK